MRLYVIYIWYVIDLLNPWDAHEFILRGRNVIYIWLTVLCLDVIDLLNPWDGHEFVLWQLQL